MEAQSQAASRASGMARRHGSVEATQSPTLRSEWPSLMLDDDSGTCHLDEPDISYGALVEGTTFDFREGACTVGSGRIARCER